ncbi:hypothetical protein PanWU01x14_154280, partial [Parasponia andersonii]
MASQSDVGGRNGERKIILVAVISGGLFSNEERRFTIATLSASLSVASYQKGLACRAQRWLVARR